MDHRWPPRHSSPVHVSLHPFIIYFPLKLFSFETQAPPRPMFSLLGFLCHHKYFVPYWLTPLFFIFLWNMYLPWNIFLIVFISFCQLDKNLESPAKRRSQLSNCLHQTDLSERLGAFFFYSSLWAIPPLDRWYGLFKKDSWAIQGKQASKCHYSVVSALVLASTFLPSCSFCQYFYHSHWRQTKTIAPEVYIFFFL